MKIKIANKKELLLKVRSSKILLTLLVYNILLVALFFSYSSLFAPRMKNAVINYFKELPKEILTAFSSRYQSSPEIFQIDISHKNFQKIAYQRHKSLQQQILSIDKEEEVPAVITHQNKKYKVNLRLKGILKDHWEDEKLWSLNVKVKGDKTLLGMRKFALQHPERRLYLNEWVFHKFAAYIGIINLRYQFIRVYINGNEYGIYALEEGLDKLLLENNERKEGVIIGFGMDFYFNKMGKGEYLKWARELQDDYFGAYIKATGEKKVLRDSLSTMQFLKASQLLEDFRRQKKTSSEVFDIEKLANYVALTDLFGNSHCLEIHNIRFYYNPITSKLEPIASDQSLILPNIDRLVGYESLRTPFNHSELLGEGKKIRISKGSQKWPFQLFADRNFYVQYIRALKTISQSGFLQNFHQSIAIDLQKNLHILKSSYPEYNYGSQKVLNYNLDYIKKCLNSSGKINAYLEDVNRKKGELKIKIKNLGGFPIEVAYLMINDTILLKTSTNGFVEGSKRNEASEELIVHFPIKNSLIPGDSLLNLKLKYQFLGDTIQSVISVFKWPDGDKKISLDDIHRAQPNINDFSFLEVDEINREILFKPGKYDLSQNLILPPGYLIKAPSRLVLNLKNKANILSYSPICFIGEKEYPILIHSSDSTGQGIIVMKAKKQSILEYVVFDNLANPNQQNWSVSGAVTFFESPVKINKCIFTNNRIGDDLLNLVHSPYSLDYSVFQGSNADALDTDFSDGIISNTKFSKVGNDGIDISGSQLIVRDIQIIEVGDKGLSAGENSYIDAKKVTLEQSELAITSKDNSLIKIENSIIKNSKVGYTVFQKKPEFGPGKIEATNVTTENLAFLHLVEEASHLSIDKKEILITKKKVADLLYGKQFGKSSH